ncbi:activating transcription factor 7-interacting protein 1-like [Sardina pilchardus]|uniref:activating transcription factor 7-interacting protein 1-like n=1 Tax=Sardina pilchardus TaxID=27697 RepID=UPI002E1181B1
MMDPRELNKEIPRAKKTMGFNRHHLNHLRKVYSGFTPYPVSKPSEKIWSPVNECSANTPEATPSNQSTDSVSNNPQIPSTVPLLHTYDDQIATEEPMIVADVLSSAPHFSNEDQSVTVETEEESAYSALLVKIETLKKFRIAPIKQPSTVSSEVMAPNKDVHDTGGHGTERAKQESDLLETTLEMKICGTANERWMRLEKVVQLVVTEHFTVFEKNLQELRGRMMKIERTIKEQTQIRRLARQLQMPKEELISGSVSMVDATPATEPKSPSTPATASTPTQGPSCSDASNPKNPDGLPAEQNSCQTNSEDALDSHLMAPNLPMDTVPGNVPMSVRPAPQPCMAQPVTCPPSHSCPAQPEGHGQCRQDTLARHPHNPQNVLSSLAAVASDSFPGSQLLLQATAQAAQRPDAYPLMSFPHAGPGYRTPVLSPTTAAPLSGGLAALPVAGTRMSPTVHPPGERDDSKVGGDGGDSAGAGAVDGANNSCEGKRYIEPEGSASVDAFTCIKVPGPGNLKSAFALNLPPTLPHLASLHCLDQLPRDALWTPVPGQPVLTIASLPSQKVLELTWTMPVGDRAALERVHSYHLFACPLTSSLAPQQLAWKNIGVVRAETLPMTCRFTTIQANCKCFFAVCAQDIYNRFGPFSRPCI